MWPRDLRPRAASMTRRSAPPMPRSGWMKMIVFFSEGADFLMEGGMMVFFFFFLWLREGEWGVLSIYIVE